MKGTNKTNMKAPIALLSILILCLCIAGIVMTAIRQYTVIPTLRETLVYVGYLLALSYALIGYRIPHGNLLRYILLLFAVLLVVTLIVNPAFYGNSTEQTVDETQTEAAEAADPSANVPEKPSGEPDVPEKPNPQSPGQAKRSNLWELSILGVIVILVAYMAGRLNRIKENRIIIVLVFLLFVARIFLVNYEPGKLPSGLNEVMMWIVLSCSYLCRYRQHREAGLLDKNQA